MQEALERHCKELNRCNQRGSRMLSIFDLLAERALDLDLAALLMARMSQGASLLVGAQSGGAGKTTLMCALLNLGPPEVELRAATMSVIGQARKQVPAQRRCYICHEIGDGCWFAYLWAHDLRDYCALATGDNILAGNLNATSPEEAQAILCGENNVPEAQFQAFDVLVFLDYELDFGKAKRSVARVYFSDKAGPHRLVYDQAQDLPAYRQAFTEDYVAQCRVFLEERFVAGLRTIEETRAHVLDFLSQSLPK